MIKTIKNIKKTLCSRLQFLQLKEAFMCFLHLAQNPCNVLIYSKLLNTILKRNLRKFTTKIFSLNKAIIVFMYSKTAYYYLAARQAKNKKTLKKTNFLTFREKILLGKRKIINKLK
jgi:hypothetical protein